MTSPHSTSGFVNCIYSIEPPCTERYARWCERSATQLMGSLLLDLYSGFNIMLGAADSLEGLERVSCRLSPVLGAHPRESRFGLSLPHPDLEPVRHPSPGYAVSNWLL